MTTPQMPLSADLDSLIDATFATPAATTQPPADPAPAPAAPEAPSAPVAVADDTPIAGFDDYLVPESTVEPSPATEATSIAPTAPAASTPTPAQDPAVQAVLASNAQLNQTIQRLMEGLTPAPAAAAPAAVAPLYDPAELQLTDEERKSYDAALPVINKTVRAALAEYHRQSAEKTSTETQTLRDQIAELQQANQTNSATSFMASVRSGVTDFDARVKTPEWKQYLAKPAPMSGGSRTIEQTLQQAIASRNTAAAIEIVNAFTAPSAPAAQPQAPGSSKSSAPPSATPLRQAPRKFAYSKFVDAGEKVRSGQMKYDDYLKLEGAYLDAAERGLVDENA